MRNRIFSIIILTACVLTGCGNQDADAEDLTEEIEVELISKAVSADTSETKETDEAAVEAEETATEDDEAAQEGVLFYGGGSGSEILQNYDYVCYVEGFYMSVDRQSDLIYVQPIEWVWNWETERWAEWGHDADEGSIYDYRDDSEEIISVSINEETEFHFENTWDDPYLYEISDRYSGRECVTTDPKVFLYYWQGVKEQLGFYKYEEPHEKDTPFTVILDENGVIKYFIEHAWAG